MNVFVKESTGDAQTELVTESGIIVCADPAGELVKEPVPVMIV
jgi:hypothetical protein